MIHFSFFFLSSKSPSPPLRKGGIIEGTFQRRTKRDKRKDIMDSSPSAQRF